MKFLYSLVLVTLCTLALKSTLHATPPAELMPTLPIEYQDAKFNDVARAFEQRWKEYSNGKRFAKWKPGRSDVDILKEYETVDQNRRKAWYVDPNASTLISRPNYIIAQDLLAKDLYRNLNTLAFDYNKTDSSYNSSTIILDGFRFLALEGPKPEHVSHFLNLLLNQHVTQLVRLTVADEGTTSMCAPYWQGKVDDLSRSLQIPQSTQGTGSPYKVEYYVMEDWPDQGAGDPKKLLDLVLKVKHSYHPQGIIACHCSSGVSRTGTFIAAFLLVNEIEREMKKSPNVKHVEVSVEKTVSQLSLLRPHAVGKPNQYLTLFRLVDLYVESLVTRKNLDSSLK